MPNRYALYKTLVKDLKNETRTGQRLQEVNKFFNQFKYRVEIDDYWKSLQEFLLDGWGDCDDYAISKYFTLLKLNLDKKAFRFAYANLTKANGKIEPHMVLLYIHSKKLTIILDNYDPKIHRLDNRKNLEIVYTFDENHVYFKDKVYPNELKQWEDLKKRISQSQPITFDDNNNIQDPGEQGGQNNQG